MILIHSTAVDWQKFPSENYPLFFFYFIYFIREMLLGLIISIRENNSTSL